MRGSARGLGGVTGGRCEAGRKQTSHVLPLLRLPYTHTPQRNKSPSAYRRPQVRELIDSILMKAGSNNARALAQSRVPHLRGIASLAPPGAEDGSEDGSVLVDVCFTCGASDDPTGARTTRVRGRQALVATGSSAVRLDAVGGLYGRSVAGQVLVSPAWPTPLLRFASPTRVGIPAP
jgi:hypothetical protein